MSDSTVNKVTITLRSLEPIQLDKAVDLLVGVLKQEGVGFVLALPQAVTGTSGRKVGAAVTLFEDLDKIGRNHLMARLQSLDFTKNVDVSVTSA